MNMQKLIVLASQSVCMATVALAGVAPGKVGTNFTAGLAYAKKHNVPIAVMWGNTSCSHCNSLSKVIESSTELSTWLAAHPIVVVEKHEEYGCQDADYLAAKEWILSLGKVSGFPYVGLYWAKDDGSDTVSTSFSGRVNKMPVKVPVNDLEGQFVGTLDEYFGDYKGGDTPEQEPEPTTKPEESEEEEEVLPSSDFGQVAKTLYAGLYGQGGMEAAITVSTGLANGAGRVKVSGTVVTLSGARKNFTAYANVGDAAISVRVTGMGQLELKFGEDGMSGSLGDLVVALCDSVGGNLVANPSEFQLAEDFPETLNDLPILTAFLPTNAPIATVGTKWATEKATGSVKWDKTAGEIVATGTNPSKLKLTYTPKTGIFKGSFYVYTPVYKYAKGDCADCGEAQPIGATIRKTSASVTGFVLNGTGVGMVQIKKVGTFVIKIR